ncbi:hypothetical protein [Paraburkholderia tropica]|uniref:hypothetical protein n=1 Tax=Paraburkholderia tropica TaxID=92647 RepID=UPI002AB28AAA|nr:hypothetical protein [Paraburkholderia tropica]
MTAVNTFELKHGIYPIAFDRRWHNGVHLMPDHRGDPVRAIADGEVVAYRVTQKAIDGGSGTPDSNAGFVLLKHKTDTGDGRSIVFYSLYMHLLDLDSYADAGAASLRQALPHFLQSATVDEGVKGSPSMKVHRKDAVGLPGACHGQRHIHFEIFMLPDDFNSYFGSTKLADKQPATPAGKDYWGHSYFIIPAGQTFKKLPDGTTTHHKPNGVVVHSINGVEFDPLQDGTNEGYDLQVEVYFHKGDRISNAWSITQDGTRTLLTPQPLREPGYEYGLFNRAKGLYPNQQSDGYELLRFGRVLSPQPAPAAGGSTRTWVSVTFASGKTGYIDISPDSIVKLSDADFPNFIGWEKISEGNTPYSDDGMCDIEELKKILGNVQPPSVDAKEYQDEDALSDYVRDNDTVRTRLRGLVCEAPTEWSSANNVTRYAKLDEPDGFYGKQRSTNPNGFSDFMKLLEKFQFWDKSELPDGKLWFFHPLQFIRAFRRCGWLSTPEFEQIYTDSRYPVHKRPHASQLHATYLVPLNLAVRKYGLTSSVRLAHFLGQGAVESAWLASMQETSMLGHLDAAGFHGTSENPASTVAESSLGHWYGAISSEDDAWFRSKKYNSHGTYITGSYDWKNGNCDIEDAQKFRGRGFKQLTGRSNYADYWLFMAWIVQSDFTKHWWDDPAYHAHHRSSMTRIPAVIDDPQRVALPENCVDSGGFYLRSKPHDVAIAMDADKAEAATTEAEKSAEFAISQGVTRAINGGLLDDRKRWEYTRAAKNILS